MENQKNSCDKEALLREAENYLSAGNWDRTCELCNRVLKQCPENAQAYLYKLLADLKCRTISDASDAAESFIINENYRQILKYGDDDLKDRLYECLRTISRREEADRKEEYYRIASEDIEDGSEKKLYEAAGLLEDIEGYRDAGSLAKECRMKLYHIIEKRVRRRKIIRICAAVIVIAVLIIILL